MRLQIYFIHFNVRHPVSTFSEKCGCYMGSFNSHVRPNLRGQDQVGRWSKNCLFLSTFLVKTASALG